VTSIWQLYVNNKVLMYLFRTAEVQHLVYSFNPICACISEIYTRIGLF